MGMPAYIGEEDVSVIQFFIVLIVVAFLVEKRDGKGKETVEENGGVTSKQMESPMSEFEIKISKELIFKDAVDMIEKSIISYDRYRWDGNKCCSSIRVSVDSHKISIVWEEHTPYCVSQNISYGGYGIAPIHDNEKLMMISRLIMSRMSSKMDSIKQRLYLKFPNEQIDVKINDYGTTIQININKYRDKYREL